MTFRTLHVRKLLCGLIALVSIEFVHGRELYPGQYAQVPPEIQEWFRSQKIPGTGGFEASCCSQADGVQGEQDVRNGQYWTRFIIEYHDFDCHKPYEGNCQYMGIKREQVDWMPVPDSVVIHNSKNPFLNPIIWWAKDDEIPSGVRIRCFAPGAGP